MEIAIPFMPMYLCHPKDDRASSEILLVIFDGRIFSLYSEDCASKSSIEGIETTRTPFSPSAASSARETSEPVAITIFSSSPSSFLII